MEYLCVMQRQEEAEAELSAPAEAEQVAADLPNQLARLRQRLAEEWRKLEQKSWAAEPAAPEPPAEESLEAKVLRKLTEARLPPRAKL